jgi:hypothetical protein
MSNRAEVFSDSDNYAAVKTSVLMAIDAHRRARELEVESEAEFSHSLRLLVVAGCVCSAFGALGEVLGGAIVMTASYAFVERSGSEMCLRFIERVSAMFEVHAARSDAVADWKARKLDVVEALGMKRDASGKPIKPLREFIDSDRDVRDFFAASLVMQDQWRKTQYRPLLWVAIGSISAGTCSRQVFSMLSGRTTMHIVVAILCAILTTTCILLSYRSGRHSIKALEQWEKAVRRYFDARRDAREEWSRRMGIED